MTRGSSVFSCPGHRMENSHQTHTEDGKMRNDLTPPGVFKSGFIGLGAMGHGMAASLLRAGYVVRGLDVYEPAIARFLSNKGKAERATSAAEAVTGVEVVFLMVQNAAQVDSLLFGTGGAADSLAQGAIVILSSTVPPSYTKALEKRLNQLGKGIILIDAPVSGGVSRAANGTLTVSDHYSTAI